MSVAAMNDDLLRLLSARWSAVEDPTQDKRVVIYREFNEARLGLEPSDHRGTWRTVWLARPSGGVSMRRRVKHAGIVVFEERGPWPLAATITLLRCRVVLCRCCRLAGKHPHMHPHAPKRLTGPRPEMADLIAAVADAEWCGEQVARETAMGRLETGLVAERVRDRDGRMVHRPLSERIAITASLRSEQ